MESQALHPVADFEALRSVPDDALLNRLTELVAQDRRVEADLVAHIGEVEQRRLFARQAFPSMFVYCTQALHLSEAEAYRRITVARAARRFEGLLDRLRDGRMHLTGMALIVPKLKPENYRAVLVRATHLSKREIQKLVAELSPRPDVHAVIRKLPQKGIAPPGIDGRCSESSPGGELSSKPVGMPGRMAPTSGRQVDAVPELGPGTAGMPEAMFRIASGPEHGVPELFPETVESLGTSTELATSCDSAVPAGPVAWSNAQAPPAVIEPLSPARYKVQFTASQELCDKLERLTALMRSEVPDGDLAAIVERAVTEKLQRLEARRFGKTEAPRKTLADTVIARGSRSVPAALRRAVYERDKGRCTFNDQHGRRCTERHRLEFHHDFPFGKGGEMSLVNIKLLCEQHNRYFAEVDYGKAAVQGKVDESRRRRMEPRVPSSA